MSCNSIPRYNPREMKAYPNKNLYTNVHSGVIYNSQDVKTTQMLINWWVEEENAILFSHKKDRNTDMIQMDEPGKHY